MQLKQYYLGCLSHASYLITDAKSKTAAVVDPQRDVAQYIEDANAAGCKIKYVFLTHFHADFLAGHIELRDQVGAKILLGQRAESEFESTKLKDGDRIEFGDTRLQILETPGHTPEGISIVVFDLAKSIDKPQSVLTGDTLFVGDVGRPDLLASIGVSADELADMLKETVMDSMNTLSLHEVLELKQAGAQLLDVRDAIDFEGAHLIGSVNIGMKGKYATWCGTVLDTEHPIILITDEGDGDEAVTRLGRIGFDNVEGYLVHGMQSLHNHPELVGKIARITAVALADQLQQDNPPLVLDVRNEKEWNAGHLEGSLNIPLNHLRERVGKIPQDRLVVIHCEGGYRSAIAASILANLGRSNIMDMVGGYKAWVASNLPTQLPVDIAAGV